MKYALVTGGTRGIGLAVVEKFVKEGYAVVATYSKDEEGANEARKAYPEAVFIRADCSKEEEVKGVFQTLPFLDVLVNNAGVSHFSMVQDVRYEEWKRVMEINAGSCFLTTKYAVKKLIEREGAIINVASVWGEVGASCESVYSASKGAVIAFTKAIAKELAPSKVKVNCISPGVIDTAMNSRFSVEEMGEIRAEIPLGRFGTAQEVAESVYFLANQGYITGQVLSVNGGFVI